MDAPSAPSSYSPQATDPACPECGYSLRGISSDQCPECGLAIDWATLSVSRLPWTHRRTIGRWRAYWRTDLLAILRPRKLAEEMNRPVSFRDAQRFRHVTVFLGWVPLAASAAAIRSERLGLFEAHANDSRGAGWWLEWLAVLAAVFACWLALFLVSGAGSYFFHPRYLPVLRQNRAIALSYYAGAPLAWIWLPALLSWAASAIESGHYRDGTQRLVPVFGVGAFALAVAIVMLCWFRVIVLMRRVTHCGPGRTVAAILYLPIAWALLFAVCGAIPAAVLYISLVVLSLR